MIKSLCNRRHPKRPMWSIHLVCLRLFLQVFLKSKRTRRSLETCYQTLWSLRRLKLLGISSAELILISTLLLGMNSKNLPSKDRKELRMEKYRTLQNQWKDSYIYYHILWQTKSILRKINREKLAKCSKRSSLSDSMTSSSLSLDVHTKTETEKSDF